MSKYLGSLATYPARTVAIGYFAMILVGGSLLAMPFSSAKPDQPISVLEGLFTATSATCVTGLSVRSTGHDFSFVGQLIILALIQIGGIGILTLTTIATLTFGTSESIRHRTTLTETLGLGGMSSGMVLRRILVVTFTIELIGAGALFARAVFEMSLADALYFSVFHSISAFCNAGFGLRDNSLCDFVGDIPVNAAIVGLIVLGGIGFPTFEDIVRCLRSPQGFRWDGLHLQTKVVLAATGILLAGGTLVIALFEWNNSFAKLSTVEALLAAAFQSTTTRTAGFNSVSIGGLTEATLFVMIVLMIVGGSPCSTAGGAKTSTVSLIVLNAWARIRGRKDTTVFRRTLDRDLVSRATALVLLYLVVGAIGIALLLTAEARHVSHDESSRAFMDCVFEAFSALGTVGLSTGVTASFSSMGKIVLILLMYIGRIGPISLAIVISQETRARRVEYAKENLLIG